MICYGLGHAVAALHPRRNPLAHRIEEPSDLTDEQYPALSIGDGATGPDMGYQPFFRLDLLPDLQAVLGFHVGDEPLIELLDPAGVLDRNAQHQHFIFLHENQTIVEWYFKNKMDDGRVEAFDGMTLVKWTAEDMICFLQEFGCNEHRYDPYQDGPVPKFRDEQAMWF